MTLVAKVLVRVSVVVEVDNTARGLAHVLLLHAAPQAFDVDTVYRTPAAVHAYAYPVVFQQLDVPVRRELAALVAVDDLRASVRGDGIGHHGTAPFRGHRVAQAPRHHVVRVDIDDGEQVYKAAPHRDVAYVELTHLVDVVYGKTFEQVLAAQFWQRMVLLHRFQGDLRPELRRVLAAADFLRFVHLF